MSDSDTSPAGGISDSFTETTSTSWLGRIGQSILGMLFGPLLIIAAAALLFWNEGRAVQTARSLAEGRGLVSDIDAGKVEPANEGKLVHVSGDLKTMAPLADAEFGVSAKAARLVRTVEMYQWKEESHTETHKNFGGSEERTTTYTYTQTWSDNRIDSAKFKRPDGHANPQMRYHRFETAARDASLGAFHPAEATLHRLAADTTFRIDPSAAGALRQRVANAQVDDGRIYMGTDPTQPRIGDLRISYHIAPAGPVSMIGRQTAADFGEFQTHAGDRLLIVQAGVLSASDMFAAAEQENRILTWILRAVGIVLMFIGFALIMRPLAVVADVIPLLGSIVGAGTGIVALAATAMLAPIVIAVAWFWYRPLVSIVVLILGFAAAYGIKRLAHRRVTARQAAPAAA